LKGAIHIHSTYSDGDLTLPELCETYRAAGCAFIALTDHAESFTAETLRAYVAECEALSSPELRVIAGLEFGCERRLHVLGIGVTEQACTRDPALVFNHVERHGGISVIAHPHHDNFTWIESFETLPHGIEVWNSKYDGRYAPRVATFDMLARLQGRRPDLRGFYSQDMHWRRQYRGLFLDARAGRGTRDEILRALRNGDFVGVKDRLRLPSSGRLTEAQRSEFGEAHLRSERIRGLMKQARNIAARWGMPVPPGVKAQLRRIF
jgi:hypothetical protein